jgi:hypothetical protein
MFKYRVYWYHIETQEWRPSINLWTLAEATRLAHELMEFDNIWAKIEEEVVA